jgi:hypothetical protein
MNDGQCKVPRTDLIWHRYEVSKSSSIDKLVVEYDLVTKYQTCLELAAQIQPISNSTVKEKRFLALTHTHDEQKRLVAELKDSDDPAAYYFLWSKGDMDARRQFLQLEGSGKLQTPTLQYHLATYYLKRDPEKAEQLLHHSLSLVSSRETLNTNTIKSLTTVHQGMGNKEQSYIWAIVGRAYDLPITSDQNLALLYPFDEQKFAQLSQIADSIVIKINEGQYDKSLIPSNEALLEL